MSKPETKNHILDTAIELFWSKSYHGVNMNELARTAGVNKATVYQHFSSKEELAVAAVARAAERTEEYVYRSTFSETDDPKDRLKRVYQKVFQMHDDLYKNDGSCRGCPFVNIGVEMSTSSEDIRRAVNQAFELFRPYYGKIIDDQAANGARRTAASREEAISTLMANMNACQVAAKLENRPEAVLDGQKRALQVLAM